MVVEQVVAGCYGADAGDLFAGLSNPIGYPINETCFRCSEYQYHLSIRCRWHSVAGSKSVIESAIGDSIKLMCLPL